MADGKGLDAALARIRELNITLGRDPASDSILAAHAHAPAPATDAPSPPDDPILASAWHLIRSLSGKCEEIEGKLRAEQDDADLLRKTLSRSGEDLDERSLQAHPSFRSHEGRVRLLQAHLEALRTKIDRLQEDPSSMFLSLGTVVRFTAAPTHPLSSTYSEPDLDYPAAGSVGVVTGLKRSGQFPIAVSMRREFRTGYGDRCVPDGDRMPTFIVDPEKVEVVEYGTFPDGNPCLSYGYVATHGIADEWKKNRSGPGDRQDEMIIEADGFFWRLHDFGGMQGVEALRACGTLAEMPWVGEPITSAGPEDGPAGFSR
jgi:hypothetical protein